MDIGIDIDIDIESVYNSDLWLHIISMLSEFQVNEFYISHVCVLLSPPHDLTKLMAKSLADGMAAIERQLDVVKSLITTEVVNSIAGSLKQVSDIPRLYRRTNREVTTPNV